MCLSFGLLFTMAGTGLAVGGFATRGAATQAQYPDRSTGLPAGGQAQEPANPNAVKGEQAESPKPSTLGEVRGSEGVPSGALRLRQAETRNDLPFTGFAAVPILLAGIALIILGAALHRPSRRVT